MVRELGLPRISVPAGSYLINKSKGGMIEAYLGTCVGVTICDRQSRVGGLVHFLLPAPTDNDNPWQACIYAATGLPLFIQTLCNEGASQEKLEACVAGGSLVGPLSGRDLILDIGGRTSDVVLDILNRENIPVRKSEIGGYFSCCLCLNLQTFETTIEPIGVRETSPVRADFQKINTERLDEVIDSILPVPQVALKIIRMINDQKSSLYDLAKEVISDQVVTAKVLRLCNSAYFGIREKIDSIERALMTLGSKLLMNIVLSTVIEDFLTQSEQGYSLCKGGLFKHALGTAMMSRRLAQITGAASADLAYTAGLLHDIGKVVLDQYMDAAYPLFYRGIQFEGRELIQIEIDQFGISHPEAGNRMAQRWFFPGNLVDAITHHHSPEMATVNVELCHIVYLADLIMSRFFVGQELEKMDTTALESRLKKIGIPMEQFPQLINRISGEISDTALL